MAEQQKVQEVNVIITNVSLITPYSYKESHYTDITGKYNHIVGYMTNEAPIKYLMEN